MGFWWLAVKDLLLVGRDKKAFLTLIMMPLLLISILGAAFGNLMNDEDVTIEKFTLGVVNMDEGQLGKVLADDVFAKGLSKQVRIKYLEKDVMKEQIKNHKISVGMVIDSNFTKTLMLGKQTKVKLITIPNPGIKATIVQSVINQFTQTVSFQTEAGKLAQSVQSQMGTAPNGSQNNNQPDAKAQINKSFIHEQSISADVKPVGSFQYYAAAMGVMFLLMTVVQGVSAMILEKEQEVYKRLLVSKLSYTNYLVGKMVGLIIVCLVQATIIIIGTKLIYGVDWGDSIAGIMLMTFSFVISACGLGVLVGSFIKKEKSFNIAGSLGTQIMAALGGSMVPIYVFPDWVATATKILPNGLALQTYLDLMSGSSFIEVLPSIALSFGLGFTFFAIGLIRLSTERRGSYA